MRKSLFEIMHRETLTRLKISHDWRTNRCHLHAAKEWDPHLKWSNYNKTFSLATIFSADDRYYNDAETRRLFKKHKSLDTLQVVLDLLRKGRHQFIECFYCGALGIRFMNNVHSDVLGLNNRRQAIRAGGIRRHGLNEAECEVIVDGLNLARGMSFKNFAARVPYGGAKITVMMNPIDLNDLDSVGFLAYAVDRSRIFTGPDMGFPTALADVMKEHFSLNITGGPQGPLGPTGLPTAYGVYLAVKQAARFKFGTERLAARKIAVQGLGSVGHALSEHFVKEKASLIVTDTDTRSCAALKEEHPTADITVVKPEEILFVEADIFSPCAVGGILTKEIIPKLRFKIILGCANNQLKASSQQEELQLATALADRGILFQVAWWHNLGGVLCGREEYERQQQASMKDVLKKVEEICTQYTWENLNQARTLGITPTENAYRSVENIIYGN
ncbi:MAG: Glu/Leu/Phe/Val dehydrogenase family protein [bacterium]